MCNAIYSIGFLRLILFGQLTFDISSGISLLTMTSRKTHVHVYSKFIVVASL